MNAQTVAFISLVFSENVRSYTSRSFNEPIWHNLCGNPDMHKAIALAQVALYAAVLTPFFSEEVLGLRGLHIGWWGWGVALLGPIATLILCETCKLITAFQMSQHQVRLAKDDSELAVDCPRGTKVNTLSDKKEPMDKSESTNMKLSDEIVRRVSDDIVRIVSGGDTLSGDVARIVSGGLHDVVTAISTDLTTAAASQKVATV
jgi:hypothetical protein